MKKYFKHKLGEIIITLTTHEGDARTRLCAVYPKILLLPDGVLPQELQREFDELKGKLIDGCKTNEPGLRAAKVRGISNSTASKMILTLLNCYDWINES
jgi:hypothetical protein